MVFSVFSGGPCADVRGKSGAGPRAAAVGHGLRTRRPAAETVVWVQARVVVGCGGPFGALERTLLALLRSIPGHLDKYSVISWRFL